MTRSIVALLALLSLTACSQGRGPGPRLATESAAPPAANNNPSASQADPEAETEASQPAAELPADMRQILEAHDRLRARHCAPPLAWSEELAAVARSWAEEMVDRGCVLEHSDHPYGENLYMGSTGVRTPAGVAEQWHAEVSDYDFRRGGFSMQTGHFTQLVWAATERLGCGRSSCDGLDVWVCMYDPPGNVQGQYRDQVKPTSCR